MQSFNSFFFVKSKKREQDIIFLGGLFYVWHSTAGLQAVLFRSVAKAANISPKVKQADADAALEERLAGWN